MVGSRRTSKERDRTCLPVRLILERQRKKERESVFAKKREGGREGGGHPAI